MKHSWNSEKKFLVAIHNNDVATAEKLFQSGIDVDTRFHIGSQVKPAICISVERGHLEMAELLIKRGCSVNQYDASGWTPLHIVAARGDVALAKLLLKSRANVRAVSTDGWIPLHYAVAHHCLEIVKLLVEAGSDINRRDQLGHTPLILACLNNDATIVEYLISKGADIHTEDFKGDNPLMFAVGVASPNLKVISMLIEAGANMDHYNHLRDTPLTMAINRAAKYDLKHNAVVELLVKSGCDLNFRCPLGISPLHAALGHQKDDIAEMLIRAGCNLDVEDSNGFTPLFYVTKSGKKHLARLLIAAGAKIIPSLWLRDEFKKVFMWDEELRLWLISRFQRVPTLQERCRIIMRKSLGQWADERIQNLTLPLTLKRYLCFKDLEESSSLN